MKRAQAPWNAAWNIPSPRDLLIEAPPDILLSADAQKAPQAIDIAGNTDDFALSAALFSGN